MADLTDVNGHPFDLQRLLQGLDPNKLGSADMILELIQRNLGQCGYDLSKHDLATIVIQRLQYFIFDRLEF